MIFLIRHGQTDYNKNHLIQGAQVDEPLNENGIKEAEELKRIFKGHHFDAVLTSPLKRARETAEIIAEDADVDSFKSDSRFIERNFGPLEGTVTTAPNFRYYYTVEIEDGESPEDLYRRIAGALVDVAYEYDGDVLIVSHGAATGSYVSNQSGEDSVKIENSSCVLVDSENGRLIDYNVGYDTLERLLSQV